MAKRLRDTETYKDRFVKGLPPDYKHLWFYILDDCDHAGIWRVDFEGASLYTGCDLNHPEAMRHLSEKVEILNSDYWFIPGFLKFQYGSEANGKAGVVISARKRLKDFGLEDRLPLSQDPPKTVQGPSQEGVETPKSKNKSKDTGFDLFWQLCKKKSTKAESLEYWTEILKPNEELQALIRRGLAKENVLRDQARANGTFFPASLDPIRWLKRKRWEDEVELVEDTSKLSSVDLQVKRDRRQTAI